MVKQWLSRLTGAKQSELAPSMLAAACFFCVLCASFMLRPLREAMALRNVDDSAILGWVYGTFSLDREIIQPLYLLYLGTLILTVLVNVPYSALVARVSRVAVVAVLFRFAMVCIAGFVVAPDQLPEAWRPEIAVLFFVWFSVFNVLTASTFWQLMVDTHRLEDSKRLFGFIGVGGTLGAIGGSASAWWLAGTLGDSALADRLGARVVPIVLMVCSVVFLEAAVQLSKRISRVRAESTGIERERIGGSALAGLTDLARSPYLLSITAYILIFTIGSTFLWFEKMRIVEASVEGQDEQTAIFAAIEFAAQSATVVLQLFLTSRIIRLFGVSRTLALVPLITILGFVSLVIAPVLVIYTAFEASRKAANYALTKPARETLFTVVSREDKYKAKALIDTFVYRGGDVLGVAAHLGVAALVVSITRNTDESPLQMQGLLTLGIIVPLGLIALALAFTLGRMQRRRAERLA